jgi:hypothetical protein
LTFYNLKCHSFEQPSRDLKQESSRWPFCWGNTGNSGETYNLGEFPCQNNKFCHFLVIHGGIGALPPDGNCELWSFMGGLVPFNPDGNPEI